MKLFQRIWQDILARQNFDIYITVVLAFMVAILGLFGIVDQTIISSAVLATLALTSVSLLMNRRENEDIQLALSRIETTDCSAEQFFMHKYDRSVLHDFIKTSHRIFFWGLTLTITIPFLKDEIERGLKSGLEVRFLLLKPSSNAVEMAAFRTKSASIDRINLTLQMNLMHLADLMKYSQNGKLEVRVVDYLPPWYMVALDPHLPTGHMFIRLNSFRNDAARPSFQLSATNDSDWFHFFIQQFEAVWEEADVVALEQYAKQRSQN